MRKAVCVMVRKTYHAGLVNVDDRELGQLGWALPANSFSLGQGNR